MKPYRDKSMRTRYIPEGSTPYAREGVDAVVYWYLAGSRLAAIAYHGTAAKPDWHYCFRTEESRAKKSEEHLVNISSHAQRIQEQAKKRKTYRHTLHVGDILEASWGYDQTNIDYYQVTAVLSGCTVEIREIGSISRETGWLQGDCVPAPGKFLSEPMKKRVGEGNGIKFASHKYAWPVEKQTIPGVEGVAIYPTAHWTAYA